MKEQSDLAHENELLRCQVAALRAEASRLKTTLYSIGDAVISADANCAVLAMNPVAEALTGWSEAEARGEPLSAVFKILSEESRSELENPAARVLREGVVLGLANHTLLIAKDGTERPIADSGAPIRDENGDITGVVLVFRDQTAERAVERSLCAALARQRALLSAVPDIVMEVDVNKIYSWANQPGLDFFGHDVIGREAASYFEDEQDTYRQVEPLFGGQEQTFYVESWQRRRDGEKRLLAWWCRVLKDESGAVVGALSTARDVTEERRVAAVLRETEERFRSFFDHAPIGKSLTAPDGTLLRVNPAFGAMLGYAVEELNGTSFVKLTHPDDLPESRECVRSLVAGEREQWAMDKRYLAKDGHVVWTHVVTRLQRDSEGRPLHLLTHMLDITARKQAEEARRAQEEKYRLLADNTLDVIWTMGLDLVFRYANPAIARLTGHTPEQWIGSKLSDHFEQAAFVDLVQLLADEIAKGPDSQGVVFETCLRKVDGKLVPVEVHAKLVCDEKGVPLLVQGVTRDITERHELHAQLGQADRLRTMGTLAAGMAHEINNPLSYVLYNMQSLSDDVPRLTHAMRLCYAALRSRVGEEVVDELLGGEAPFSPALLDDFVERFRDALSGTIRIREISRGLGTLSRVDQNEAQPVDLHHAVEQAIHIAFNEIKYRARLVKDLGPLPMVLGSDGKLAQVFLNLLINAAHAIDEGHVERNEIRVRTWAEGDDVFAEVCDTGRGIAAEHQARVFEPFFTTKGVGVGTGLGLSICRNIVGGFGGEVSFTSEEGKGTRFLVRLPRMPDGWEARSRAPQELAPAGAVPRGRILLVDDEAGIRRAIVRVLERDHEVLAVSSGHEAQALLMSDWGFDLIFCDLMMPEMSGMELHAWLVECEPSLAERVVFITGGAFTPGASEYLRKVGNRRVEKPFDAVALKKTTAELVLAAKAMRGQ